MRSFCKAVSNPVLPADLSVEVGQVCGAVGVWVGRPQGDLGNKAIAQIAAEQSRYAHLESFLLGDLPTQWYESLLHTAQ